METQTQSRRYIIALSFRFLVLEFKTNNVSAYEMLVSRLTYAVVKVPLNSMLISQKLLT